MVRTKKSLIMSRPSVQPVHTAMLDSNDKRPTTVHLIKCGVQWNLSLENTTETQLAVLYREVSLMQRIILKTQLYLVGTADSALIRE